MSGLSPAPDGWREEDDEDAAAAGLELGLELERELEGVDADFCLLDDSDLAAGEPPPELPLKCPGDALELAFEADWRAS